MLPLQEGLKPTRSLNAEVFLCKAVILRGAATSMVMQKENFCLWE